MANDVERLEGICEPWAFSLERIYQWTNSLLFAASRHFGFVAMHIIGSLELADSGNTSVIVATDRFSKLTKAVRTSKETTLHIAISHLDIFSAPSGIPKTLCTYNGRQFLSKFFGTVCQFFAVKDMTTTAYLFRVNGEIEGDNKTISTRFQH